MAVGLVKMDKAQLDNAITATADVIRQIYYLLYQQTGDTTYQTAAQALYEWGATNGLYTPIYNAVGALLAAGGGSGSGLTLKSGQVIPAENADTLTITPVANQKPFFAIIWRASGNGSYNVNLSCYFKLPMSVSYSNQPTWAHDDLYGIFHSENGQTGGLYTSNVDEGVASSGAITFGTRQSTRRYPAGDTYKWVAIYGEVYNS